MRPCTTCGTVLAPIRVDGECFRCHVRGIAFTFRGGAFSGRADFHISRRDYIDEHVGEERIRNGEVELLR